MFVILTKRLSNDSISVLRTSLWTYHVPLMVSILSTNGSKLPQSCHRPFPILLVFTSSRLCCVRFWHWKVFANNATCLTKTRGYVATAAVRGAAPKFVLCLPQKSSLLLLPPNCGWLRSCPPTHKQTVLAATAVFQINLRGLSGFTVVFNTLTIFILSILTGQAKNLYIILEQSNHVFSDISSVSFLSLRRHTSLYLISIILAFNMSKTTQIYPS